MTTPETRDALAESIVAFEAGGYPIDTVVPAVCLCGWNVFRVVYEEDVGIAIRTCTSCDDEYPMLDTDEFIDDVDEVFQAICTCDHEEFHVAVGFSLLDGGGEDSVSDAEVRWVSIGLECTKDGVAGVYADWTIDYQPSRHLLALA